MTMASPAHAIFGVGDIVFDPSNLAQNLITAANTLTMIDNQIEQLANEAQMLINEARNLEALPDSIAGDLKRTLEEVDGLIHSAEGLAYEVDTIEAQYKELYPDSFAPGTTTPEILANAQAGWAQARSGYKDALKVQAQIVGTITTDTALLDKLVADSQAATGALQATQAGNQLTALATKQSMQLQELIAAQSRAEDLERASALTERERGRSRLKQFIGDGTPYNAGQ
jgi:P-type conjugative transfer protein TrbJ